MATNKRLIKSNDEGGVAASFNTVIYSGTSGTQSITGVGFQPDLVWVKNRTGGVTYHAISDVVRGANKMLSSNDSIAEYTDLNMIKSFDIDGFTVGDSYAQANANGYNFVAWCWKAGGAAVTNTDGTITSQVSANTEAGFSIVSYTGNGQNLETIGHGLGKSLDFWVIKQRNSSSNGWNAYHSSLGLGYKLGLDSTGAASYQTYASSIVSPTNEVFSVKSTGAGWDNATGGTYIAYCFAEVAGFSKFGSHTTAAKITTDFEPAWVMIKYTGVANNWWIMDLARWDGVSYGSNGGKLIKPYLMANSSSQELSVPNGSIEVLSDGFYPTNYFNAAGAIHMAFANQF